MIDTAVTIILPAALAGLVAVAATLAIERWGGVVGGLLGSLPTTIVPASLGIWATSADRAAFADAMGAVGPGMFLDAGFLYLWRLLPPHLPQRGRLGWMLALSILAWLGGAVLVVGGMGALRDQGFSMLSLGTVVTVGLVIFGLMATWRPRAAPPGSRPVGPAVLAARAVLAAVAIGTAIWIAKVGGGLAAGVASVFPAIFITTMVALWISQGEQVQGGAVGPMMLGASSVAAFALLSVLTYPTLGLVLGAVVAWLGAVALTSVPAYAWVRWRQASEDGVS